MPYILNNSTANAVYLNNAQTTSATGYTINTSSGANGSWNAPMTVKPNATIELKGEGADVIMNGKSLKEAISSIESRLAILKPDPRLENEWAELKALGDAYRALEKEINEKMKTWDILKRED